MRLLKTVCNSILLIIISNCVQETHLKTITIKLDMNAVGNVSNVGVRGDFTKNPWKETLYLNDDNDDGIYEGTFLQKTAFNSVEFKFVNQDSIFELQGKNNRVLKFEYKPETIIYQAEFDNLVEKKTVIE